MDQNVENAGRRSFVKGSAIAATVASAASMKKVLGANDRVRVAVVGLNGRGWNHVSGFHTLQGVDVAYFCDADENVLSRRIAECDKMGLSKPQTYTDYRKLLEDKNVDAVSIATPNHWHSLMGIWAAQAGKDIYIEKPCSHNLFEGQQLVKAIDKYKVICQHGSQCRSSVAIREAMDNMHSGLLGDTYMARGLCYKWRGTIGKAEPAAVPEGVHYDLWTGPAPLKQFTKNRFHYNWHWIWDTGNGDLGNQGIHEVDLARWGMGVTLPTKVTAMGGHFLFDDDQQTPNNINVAYEFETGDGKTKMITFEVRGWMTNHEAGIGTDEFSAESSVPQAGLGGKSVPKPATIGNIYYGSKGYLAISNYDSYKTWMGEQGTAGPSKTAPVRNEHYQNFVDCVRSRRAADLHAPIIEGHRSAILVHLANASYRLGRTINFDPKTETVVNDVEAAELLRGVYRAPYVVPETV